jgi:hypothetical protein
VTITANATDNHSVSRVEFYVNNTLVCTDTGTPYSCPWKTPMKTGVTSNITVKAYDPSGNVGTDSISVHT